MFPNGSKFKKRKKKDYILRIDTFTNAVLILTKIIFGFFFFGKYCIEEKRKWNKPDMHYIKIFKTNKKKKPNKILWWIFYGSREHSLNANHSPNKQFFNEWHWFKIVSSPNQSFVIILIHFESNKKFNQQKSYTKCHRFVEKKNVVSNFTFAEASNDLNCIKMKYIIFLFYWHPSKQKTNPVLNM